MSADLRDARLRRIAYFSMEVGIDVRLPTYSGGLGVLAGDTLRTFADLRMPAVGVTLLYRRGYFQQRVTPGGIQQELPVEWEPASLLHAVDAAVTVTISGRAVRLRAWRYDIAGIDGYVVPLLFLDADVDGNDPADRRLTDTLYGGDDEYRLDQEVILGIGGVRLLRALGFVGIERFHMNEGHSALLALELLYEEDPRSDVAGDIERVRAKCMFTTHTPVDSGHDRFGYALVLRILGEFVPLDLLRRLGGEHDLNMTLLALNLSHYVNGVAKRHGEISQRMFPGYPIDSITNGVHSVTWTSEPFAALFDAHIPRWRRDPFSLRYAIKLPLDALWSAHAEAKRVLLDTVRSRAGVALDPDTLTIGFARRATSYKRPDLVLQDVGRLRAIRQRVGPFQLLLAGKAHPRDAAGKAVIQTIVERAAGVCADVPIVYLEDYDIALAKWLTAGVDLWLNTPLPPLEASGTSGMKAAHNGVPSLSTLDGWWVEGHIEGVTGWSAADAPELYTKLETVILPLFRGARRDWTEVMRRTIALNASFFNSHRMIQQYAVHGYV